MSAKLTVLAALLCLPLISNAAAKRSVPAPKGFATNSYETDPRVNPRCFFSSEQAIWICN